MTKNTGNTTGKTIAWLIVLVAVFAAGYAVGSRRSNAGHSDHAGPVEVKSAQIWYCSMHPQIRQDKPGLCPICNMALIPLEDKSGGDMPGEISFSDESLKLMEVATTAAQRKAVEYVIQVSGRVKYDERTVSEIAAWTGGRIQQLFVDYTGQVVAKGSPMVEIYSPELNTAAEEYYQALHTFQDAGSGELLKKSAKVTMDLALQKMTQMGLTPEQVEQLTESENRSLYVTINAPSGGTVIEKKVVSGNYVMPGQLLYNIADLNKLWVILDVFENDIAAIKIGSAAEFTTAAYPGRKFEGLVSFISPTVDPMSRTVSVRVDYDNSSGELKPDMLVKGMFHIQSDSGSGQLPLVIPTSAPLLTGKRALVYVAVPNKERSTYVGREVILGRRLGDYYEVVSGLEEGQQVVVSGNFKIDSAIQISGSESMMKPAEEKQMPGMDMNNDMDMDMGMDMNMDMDNMNMVEQTTCPVMGGKIDKNIFIEYKGKKVYFCCNGCKEQFLADPEKYLVKLPQFQGENSGK